MRDRTGYAFYMNTTSISPRFYQTLLDRYWRRSGKLLYRPDQQKSCCPHYTIRLDSFKFKPSRAQRQTVNRFNSFITGDNYGKAAAQLHPRSREEAKHRDNNFVFTERIHEAECSRLKTPPNPDHRLEVTLEADTFTEEKWTLFGNYQTTIHKEPPEDRSRRSFKSFLCSSPLRRETMTGQDGKQRQLGSFHQCYRLDGKLVAVGVLDLLPHCVSSVYFFYHDSIHRFAPGKLSALREIALAVEQGYRWWYPGYYIHSCPKMRYKIDYAPSFMLDPIDLSWDLIDSKLLKLLDERPFISLALEGAKTQTEVKAGDGKDAGKVDGQSSLPLGHGDATGAPSQSAIEAVEIDHITIKAIPNGRLLETSDLREWKNRSVLDWPLKAAIAELIAAVGPDLKESICVDFLGP